MLKDMYKVNHNAKHYTTWPQIKVLVGENIVLERQIRLGILSKTYIYDDDMLENLIASANFVHGNNYQQPSPMVVRWRME